MTARHRLARFLLCGLLGVISVGTAQAGLLGSDGKPSILNHLPEKVEFGSIAVPKPMSDRDELRRLDPGKVTAEAALRIVQASVGGAVVELELGGESGYLVWDVETQLPNGHGYSVLVDAGNGRILAARSAAEPEQRCAVPGIPASSRVAPPRADRHWWQIWKSSR